jgi:hypothetical protein
MKDIESFAIQATDGILGRVKDFYFDDESWVVRYFVVETGIWHANRRTLISPIAMGIPNWSEKLIPAALTQAQVKNAPDIDTDKPVSRQHEMGYLGYYGYPNYWGGGGLWGAGMYPDMLQGGLDPATENRGNRRERRLLRHAKNETDEAAGKTTSICEVPTRSCGITYTQRMAISGTLRESYSKKKPGRFAT